MALPTFGINSTTSVPRYTTYYYIIFTFNITCKRFFQGEDQTSEATALGLKNVGGVFGVTIMGVVAACFLVFIEMTLHVIKVSFKYKTPIARNLKQELKFYFKFKGMVKPALKTDSEKSSEKSNETFHGFPNNQQCQVHHFFSTLLQLCKVLYLHYQYAIINFLLININQLLIPG